MPTRLRSIWHRYPDPIPPPVVCRVEPIPLVQADGNITVRLVSWETRIRQGGYALVYVGLTLHSLPGLTSGSCSLRSKSWSAGTVPNQPINPMNDEPLPMPWPTWQTVDVNVDDEYIAAFASSRYDDVYHVIYEQPGTVLYNLYFDTGRMIRNERYTNG